MIAFLQAGGAFTFYPPRRPIDAATRTLDAPCAVSVRLQMKGAYGHLVLRTADGDDGSDDEAEDASVVGASTKPSSVFLSIPFELVFQAKPGTAPGCFNLPDVHAFRQAEAVALPLPPHTHVRVAAREDRLLAGPGEHQLPAEGRLGAGRDGGQRLHPHPGEEAGAGQATRRGRRRPVAAPQGAHVSRTAHHRRRARGQEEPGGRQGRTARDRGAVERAVVPGPSAPEKRSAVDVARKVAKTGKSNVLEDTPPQPLARDVYSAPEVVPVSPMPAPVMGDDGSVPMAPSMDGVPMAPGMGGPSSAAVRHSGPRLRRLLWEPVNGDCAEGTLWSENNDEDASAASDVWQEGHAMLVQLFSLADAKAGRLLNGKGKEEERAVRVFDSKRAQNIEIALRAFRMPNGALHEAVLAMDMTILNPERLTSLLACCPTADELMAMRRWEVKQGRSPDYSSLPKAEQFAFLMNTIPHYGLRLRGMLFRLRYKDMVDGLVKHFGRLSRACQAVRDSRRFRRVLRLILSIGNAMNRSASTGFHLTALDELSRTKSSDGRSTLMDFIASYLHLRQQRRGGKDADSEAESESDADGPYLAELSSVLQHVSLVDVAALQDERAAVVQGLAELEGEVAALRAERAAHPEAAIEGDEFVEQMADFVDEALERSALLHQQWTAFQQRQADLLSYLNEVGELGIGDVFGLLARFCDALAAAEGRRVDKAKRDEQAAAKHRRMQTEPTPQSAAAVSIAQSNMQDVIKAHALKRKEGAWDE